MTKKDVLIMCQFFYPEYITSALLPYHTAVSIRESGMNVDVISGYPKEYSTEKNIRSKETVDGVNITRVKYLQLSRGNMLTRLINYFSFIVSMFFQIPKIKHYKLMIIYSNPPILPIIALIANKLYGTKILFVAYDIYPEIGIKTDKINKNGFINKIMDLINKKLYPISDVVALSNEMKAHIINHRKIASEKVHVINNWATEEDNELIKDNKEDSVKLEKDGPYIISYLGNMGIPQEFKTLLKAMNSDEVKQLDIELHLAGHGNQREKISEYIEDNQLSNVHLHGYLQDTDFESLVNKTDAFFLSLKNSLNGLAVPSKYYTYLFSKKPIIAVINPESDIAKEISKHAIGFVVRENDVARLITAIKEIRYLNYPVKDIYYSNYSKKIQLNKYINIIHKIVNEDIHMEGMK